MVSAEPTTMLTTGSTGPDSGEQRLVSLPIAQATGPLAHLVRASFPRTRLAEVILPPKSAIRLQQLVREFQELDRLQAQGLTARRKFLLVGPTGSGKRLTASALAGALNLPLMRVMLHEVLASSPAETQAKLRRVFEAMSSTRGVYLFEELESLGGSLDPHQAANASQHAWRAFLQGVEYDESDSLIVATTCHQGPLDSPLLHRFEDVIHYEYATLDQSLELIRGRLSRFETRRLHWAPLLKLTEGLSLAEVARACDAAARSAVLARTRFISQADLRDALTERRLHHWL